MHKTYRVKASELDQTFVEELKATFKDKQIEIVISEAPTKVCLYDFEAIESEGAPIDPSDIHIDDGSIESFLRSGKKTLRGRNGEKPVGKIIRIETNETPDERWQALFDSIDQELSMAKAPTAAPTTAVSAPRLKETVAEETATEKSGKDR